MTRRAPSAGALLAALLLATLGCAGTSTTGGLTAGAGTGGEDPRIMVTLPASQRGSWDRITAELSLAYSLRVYQAWRMRSLPVRCVIFDLPPGTSYELILRRLSADPRVESAEPIRRYRTLSSSEDPYGHLQHGAHEIRAGGAHRWATGRGVRVAVVDTGVDIAHPDLDGRIFAAHNFVDRGEKSFTRDVHGTAIAGIVAATAGNGAGIAGVAPGAFLMALKACWPAAGDPAAAECDSYTLAKALDWALAEDAQVLNLSLTGPPDPLLGRLLDIAREQGVPVVAAAEAVPGFPANHPGVIAVHAGDPGSDADGQLAAAPAGAAPPGAGAAAGRVEPLTAPGVDILTTVPGGGYEFLSGSSMAAAHVSGVVALLLERRPNLRPDAVERLLRTTARAVAESDVDGGAEQVVIDACGAVTELIGQAGEGCAEPVGLARESY